MWHFIDFAYCEGQIGSGFSLSFSLDFTLFGLQIKAEAVLINYNHIRVRAWTSLALLSGS